MRCNFKVLALNAHIMYIVGLLSSLFHSVQCLLRYMALAIDLQLYTEEEDEDEDEEEDEQQHELEI